MSELDELIPDTLIINVWRHTESLGQFTDTISGTQLKAAIRAEIDAKIAEHVDDYIHAEWGRASTTDNP